MNFLGLDIGERKTGVAIADNQTRVVRPYGFLANNRSFVNELKKIVQKEGIKKIIVGLPVLNSGHEGKQVQHVKEVTRKIIEKIQDVEIILHDERYSSRMASSLIRGKKHKKEDIDMLAATVILNSWLTQQNK